MSSFITVIINIDEQHRDLLKEALHRKAELCGIGVWFNDRYIDEFEMFHQTPNTVAFNIADNYLFNNCEELVTPWWYCDCGEELFAIRMGKIRNIVEECFKYVDEVNLFIGTSGALYDDFKHVIIFFTDLHSEIVKQYEADRWFVPPLVHFVIKPKLS